MRISFHRVAFCALACGLGAVTLDLPIGAKAANSGVWTYAPQAADDGSLNRVMAHLMGEEGGALWLTCTRTGGEEGGETEPVLAATVTQKAYLGTSAPPGRSTVYWLDGKPPEVSYWIYRDRYGQLREQDKVKSFVASLATAQTLIVDLADYRLEARSVKFSLEPSETKAIIERFARDCQVTTLIAN